MLALFCVTLGTTDQMCNRSYPNGYQDLFFHHHPSDWATKKLRNFSKPRNPNELPLTNIIHLLSCFSLLALNCTGIVLRKIPEDE